MYHGEQFDACGLPRGHYPDTDHEGMHTKVRFRTLSRTESYRTGLGETNLSDRNYQPSIFETPDMAS